LSRALALAQPLPIARIPAQEDGPPSSALARFRNRGAIIPNGDLQMELSSLKFALVCSDDSLTAIPAAASLKSLSAGQVALLVTGRLLSNRVEVEERTSRGRKQTVDSRQFSSDEAVLDIYARHSGRTGELLPAALIFPVSACQVSYDVSELYGFDQLSARACDHSRIR